MLKFVEYGLLAVSVVIVLALIVLGPGSREETAESTNLKGEPAPPLGSVDKH
jgi:hypothetical protein